MQHTTWPRLILSFLAGYFVSSNLNRAIAELWLNPWATPRFDGFMRVGEAARRAGCPSWARPRRTPCASWWAP